MMEEAITEWVDVVALVRLYGVTVVENELAEVVDFGKPVKFCR